MSLLDKNNKLEGKKGWTKKRKPKQIIIIKKPGLKKKKKNSMRSKKNKIKNQKTEKLKTKGNLKKIIIIINYK